MKNDFNKNLNRVLNEIAEIHGDITPGGFKRPLSDRKLAPILKTSSPGIGDWRSGKSRPSVNSEDAIAEARGWTRTQLVAVIEDEDPIDLICWAVYLLRPRECNNLSDEDGEEKLRRSEKLQQAMLFLSSANSSIKKKLREDLNAMNLSEEQANKLSRLILFLESHQNTSGYDFFDDLEIGEAEKEKLHMIIHFSQVERPVSRDTLNKLAERLPIVASWNPIKISNNKYYSSWEQLENSLNGTRNSNK